MKSSPKKDPHLFSQQVGIKEYRKIKAIHNDHKSVWFGIGMMGIIGWSITVPTILGAMLGMWLDNTSPESFSRTLTCLILGLFCGCLIAWFWVSKEHKEMNKKEEDDE